MCYRWSSMMFSRSCKRVIFTPFNRVMAKKSSFKKISLKNILLVTGGSRQPIKCRMTIFKMWLSNALLKAVEGESVCSFISAFWNLHFQFKRIFEWKVLIVELSYGTSVPKTSKMHFLDIFQPWIPKMFQRTATEKRRIRCWHKNFLGWNFY